MVITFVFNGQWQCHPCYLGKGCNSQCNDVTASVTVIFFSVVSVSAILATWAKVVTASVTVTGPARTPIRACVTRPGGGQSVRSGVAQVKVATAADTETATARCKLVGVTLVSWSVYFLGFFVFVCLFGFCCCFCCLVKNVSVLWFAKVL